MLSPDQTQEYRPRITYFEYVELLNYIGRGLRAIDHKLVQVEFNPKRADAELAKFDAILDQDFDTDLVEMSEGDLAVAELEQELAGPPWLNK
jgi:hypothetical protein